MKSFLKNIKVSNEIRILLLIFLFGLVLRFLYFPYDISFGYDQARDAYVSRQLMLGDIKIVGPKASAGDFYHGALIYYILGPLYKIFRGNPFTIAFFFRIVNSIGIILIYHFINILFKSRKTALIGAFLYAISFEQTQFSLFLGHPALGVITSLIFFIGLADLIFSKKISGLYTAMLGLGLTIQFHFSSIILFITLILTLIIYRKKLPKLSLKNLALSVLILITSLSTYIIAEFKYNFRSINALSNILHQGLSGDGLNINNLLIPLLRTVKINSINVDYLSVMFLLLIIAVFFHHYKKNVMKAKLKFLSIIIFVNILPFAMQSSDNPPYYYNLSISLLFITLFSFTINFIKDKFRLLGLILLLIIFVSNIILIFNNNRLGTVVEINAQEGMLLTDAIKVIDYTYEKAMGNPFSVSAVTIPYKINTTWSYLYEWHGKNRYGYMPIWGGESALGFDNVLTIETAQSKLPPIKFTIIEPTRGLTGELIDSFLESEDFFWDVVDEVRYGEFTVQQRAWRKVTL